MPANDTHVYPLNDLREHVTVGTECPCQPRVEVHGAELLVIHNSYDFREVFEELDTLVEDVLLEYPHKPTGSP